LVSGMGTKWGQEKKKEIFGDPYGGHWKKRRGKGKNISVFDSAEPPRKF